MSKNMGRLSGMTRAQQIATKKLLAAQEEWLISYKWVRTDRGWKHPRFEYTVTLKDAMQLTWGDPTLGWP